MIKITEKELKKIKEKYPEFEGKGRHKDLTNKIFGKLIALYRFNTPGTSGKCAQWVCQCSCGNITIADAGRLNNGSKHQCQECTKKQRHKIRKSSKNLVNKKFGSLLVLEETNKRDNFGNVKWKCQCDCGQITYVTTSSLTSGNSTTCGAAIHRAKDLTNKRFNKLVAIQIMNKQDKAGHFYWKCLCDCGTIVETTTHNLITGRTQSCGCIKSKGEEKIAQLLSEKNIFFEKEKHFLSCGKTRFDFYVNNSYIIEFDGSQHFKYTNTGWDTKKHFERTHKNDLIKNKYCFENNIPLIRIPYDAEYNLKDLVLETTRFLLTPENEQKYYNR